MLSTGGKNEPTLRVAINLGCARTPFEPAMCLSLLLVSSPESAYRRGSSFAPEASSARVLLGAGCSRAVLRRPLATSLVGRRRTSSTMSIRLCSTWRSISCRATVFSRFARYFSALSSASSCRRLRLASSRVSAAGGAVALRSPTSAIRLAWGTCTSRALPSLSAQYLTFYRRGVGDGVV